MSVIATEIVESSRVGSSRSAQGGARPARSLLGGGLQRAAARAHERDLGRDEVALRHDEHGDGDELARVAVHAVYVTSPFGPITWECRSRGRAVGASAVRPGPIERMDARRPVIDREWVGTDHEPGDQLQDAVSAAGMEPIVRGLTAAAKALRLYPPTSPIPRQAVDAAAASLTAIPRLRAGAVAQGRRVTDSPGAARPSHRVLRERRSWRDALRDHGVAELSFLPGVTTDDLLTVLGRDTREARGASRPWRPRGRPRVFGHRGGAHRRSEPHGGRTHCPPPRARTPTSSCASWPAIRTGSRRGSRWPRRAIPARWPAASPTWPRPPGTGSLERARAVAVERVRRRRTSTRATRSSASRSTRGRRGTSLGSRVRRRRDRGSRQDARGRPVRPEHALDVLRDLPASACRTASTRSSPR